MEFLITKQSAEQTSTAAHTRTYKYASLDTGKLDRVKLDFQYFGEYVRRKVLALCQKTLILQCVTS